MVKNVFEHWQMKMCRPIDHTYWFFIFFPRAASRCLRKLPINWKVSENSVKCDCEFSFLRKKTAPPESVEHDACVRHQVVPQHLHKRYDTLLCKCQSHPIKCSSDAIAHKGFPPIKFCVCYQFSFLFFLLFRRHFINKCVVHTRPCSTLTDRTHELLQ